MARNSSNKIVARDVLAKLGFEPIEHLVSIAAHEKCPPQLKLEVCKSLLPFIYPKKAEVDVVDERAQANNEFEERVNHELLKSQEYRRACELVCDFQVAMRVRLRQAARATVLDDIVEETGRAERGTL